MPAGSDERQRIAPLAASTAEIEDFNRILLIVHGLEDAITVTLPEHEGVTWFELLWDSSTTERPRGPLDHAPGSDLTVGGTTMLLFRAH